jgi:PAS domain S-box-containing protein
VAYDRTRSLTGQAFETIDGELLTDETRFHVLLDTLPFIAFVMAPDGSAEHYNQRFVEYHGFVPSPEGASRIDLLHPGDRPGLLAARQDGVAAGTEYVVEARLRRHDGAYRWHRIHNKPLVRAGHLAGWLGTAIDIHDVVHANQILEHCVRKRTAELRAANRELIAEIRQRRRTEEGLRASEAGYRRLYNRTPMALHSVDAQARLIDVNDTWLAMFEYARNEVIGRSPVDFMTRDSAAQYRDWAWPEMLASAGQLKVADYQFVTRSGRVFDGRLAASGEFDANGFVRSWAALADVTAEKQADREYRQAQRMDAVGQLTAGIAHDFNNLLTAVLGNLELLSKRPLQDAVRTERLIAGARAAAHRGAKLTTQLLAFSRKQEIAAEPVDLNRLIAGMAPLLRSTIGGDCGINIQADASLARALADPAQLELAILNLAINARDAMPDGGAITIATSNAVRGEPVMPEEPTPGDYVAVCVSDTGSGISDAVRERIFEPFFTTKEIGKGSGLGLPQVLGVVKQLGGGLAVESAPEAGTSISVFLPRVTEAARSAKPAQRLATSKVRRRPRVQLGDDDAAVRSLAANMLDDAGYEVAEASSGAAALAALKRDEESAELVLVDVATPGVDGVEFAAVVRSNWPALPVLLMSGYTDSMAAGHGILRKPLQAAEMEARLRQAMARVPPG